MARVDHSHPLPPSPEADGGGKSRSVVAYPLVAYEWVRKELRVKLEALAEITDRLICHRDPDSLLRELAAGLVAEAGAVSCRIWLRGSGDRCALCDESAQCTDRRECLHLAASANANGESAAELARRPIAADPLGLIVRTGTLLTSDDISNDARFPDKQWIASVGAKSCLALPLGCREESLGVLALFTRRRLDDAEVQKVNHFIRRVTAVLRCMQEIEILQARVGELESEKRYLEAQALGALPFELMTGTSTAIRELRSRIETVASQCCPVVIVGPPGAGKELVAYMIHAASPRAGHVLVEVPCGEAPDSMVEGLLFGHEPHALSNEARPVPGRLELAGEGTLFLNRVDRLSGPLQPKLYHVLSTEKFSRLGGELEMNLRARVVASCGAEPARLAEAGSLDPDLAGWLNRCVLFVPGLSERREELPMLIQHAVNRYARRHRKEVAHVDPGTLRQLAGYDWPGNLRELCRVIEHAVLASSGDTLVMEEGRLPLATRCNGEPPSETLIDIERAHILRVLRKTGGMIQGPGGAARILGLHPSTLRSRMARLGISRDGFDADRSSSLPEA